VTTVAPDIRTLTRPPYRCNFQFSPRGNLAVCLRSEADDDRYTIELWTFEGGAARTRDVGSVTGNPFTLQPIVGDTGTVLVSCARDGKRHDVIRIDSAVPGSTARLHASVQAAGFVLCAADGLAVSYTEPVSTVWAMDAHGGLRSIVEMDGVVTGGHLLDTAGRYVAFNRRTPDGALDVVRVDIRERTTHRLVPGQEGTLLLLAHRDAGRLLFAVDVDTEPRLAAAVLDRGTMAVVDMHVPANLNETEGTVLPLTFDDRGGAVLLSVGRGVRTHLIRHELATDQASELPLPLGVIIGPGRWTDAGLRFPFTTPTLPYGVATTSADPADGTGIGIATPRDGPTPFWTSAAVEQIRLTSGDVEALVYGADWRSASRVLIALHGGPESAWRAEFDHLLQVIAAAGITVIAPNQRGSTGYGPRHQQAIHHAWGGPDLADITDLADHITAHREGRLMLLGISYGAYLGLLAAATQPARWSHCVAVSPFLSGQRLHEDGSAPVRRLLDRLGGRTALDDDIGPRDLTRLAPSISANTLIVHGSDDDIIPVGHAREINRLLRSDRRYVEIPGGDHFSLANLVASDLITDLIDFLGKGGDSS
jgi:pimeloyl-ACP methyl ester carboxylesterase